MISNDIGVEDSNAIIPRGIADGAFIKCGFAVEGMTLAFIDSLHTGTITITGSPSMKARKIPENKYVYKDKLAIAISNGGDGSTTDNATGTGEINASEIKSKLEGEFVLRRDDKSTVPIIMTGTNRNPPPATMTYTTQVKISDPAQDKCRGV
jgi:hypothetical protein